MSGGIKKQDFMSKIMDQRRMGKHDGRKLMKNNFFELKKGKKRSIIDYVERIEFPLLRLADAVKGLIAITSQCTGRQNKKGCNIGNFVVEFILSGAAAQLIRHVISQVRYRKMHNYSKNY